MKTYTFIAYDPVSHLERGRQFFEFGEASATSRRTNARKFADMLWCNFSQAWDKYDNEILYTRKDARFVYIVDNAKLADGAYERDPVAILDDPAALAAAKARYKTRPKRGERYTKENHAARIAEALQIEGLDGKTVTPLNAPELRKEVRKAMSDIKREQTELWEQYLKDSAALAKRLDEKTRQRDALNEYIRRNPYKEEEADTYTAQEAAKTTRRKSLIQTAAPAPQNAPTASAAQEEPKGAFFDPAKYQMSPTPSAGMNPDECDFI